ncbi:succinate dehydrogenase [Candidatus Thiomargarita nelsonii]|uniref:Succinate dehydrogenase hydrophobic membrane anchor subunit n=1 Tax=Candidatus Thiomargarita nelsonii TaxID=1003181 RepID=A0A0A6PJP9_9GAMM|nr:succinate dehydrogenase [Candidatus Thiomargarita nelsonii]
MNELRTSLSRVRFLGSAREGANRFIAQRLSAIALVPLLLWFVASIIFFIVKADHASLVAWIRLYWNTELLILLIIILFYHTHSGLQEILEDYVHNEIIKAIAMVSMKFFVIAITVASVLAVLRIALGA